MATYTTNINLKKPAQSDKIRIADINNNMDDIDAAFGAIGNDSVATQIGNVQEALAIVAVGDSHAAITSGQFVYVKSHETLDAGLYVATANIAQNAALSSSNLTADSSGGLNALNSNINNKEDKFLYESKQVTLSSSTFGQFYYADYHPTYDVSKIRTIIISQSSQNKFASVITIAVSNTVRVFGEVNGGDVTIEIYRTA